MKHLTKRQKQHRDYLQSHEWAEIRCDMLQDSEFKCFVCGKVSRHNQVHHLNYNNWMHEEPGDLIVLCSKHHKQAHGLSKKRKKFKKRPPKKGPSKKTMLLQSCVKRDFIKALALSPSATWGQIAAKIQSIAGGQPLGRSDAKLREFCIKSAQRLATKGQ